MRLWQALYRRADAVLMLISIFLLGFVAGLCLMSMWLGWAIGDAAAVIAAQIGA